MPRVLRSPGFVLATLAAFVLMQPAAWCSALCLLEGNHHPAAPVAAGAGHASATLGGADCHTAESGALHRAPLPALSPMAPAGALAVATAPSRWVAPARSLVTSPAAVSPAAEPPPPRLV